MKIKSVFIGCFLAVLLFILHSSITAMADEIDNLEQSLTNVISVADEYDEYDYDAGDCLFSYYLSEDVDDGKEYYFEEGQEYLIVAAGDDNVVDVDLIVTDEQDQEILTDSSEDSSAVIEFMPAYTGNYTIHIKNYKSDQDGFCSYVVLRKTDGNYIPESLIYDAFSNALNLAREESEFPSFPVNHLVMFGGYYAQEQNAAVECIDNEEKDYVFFAAGDNVITDVNALVVKKDMSKNKAPTEVYEGNGPENYEILHFSAGLYDKYALVLENHDIENSGFVFGLLLEEYEE